MRSFELSGWKLILDREATVNAYDKIAIAGPEACGCDSCRNWAASRVRVFPVEFCDLLHRLGILRDREAEVYHNGRVESGLHSYGGWYHFVGEVLFGEKEDASPLVFGDFRVFFHSRPALLPRAFTGQRIVQMEFEAEVPWLSEIAESA